MLRKILPLACVPLGTAAGYLYLVRLLRPARPAFACPFGEVRGWQCASYQFIVSKPTFAIGGALVGLWIAVALVGLYAAPRRPAVARREMVVVAPPLVSITAWIIALQPGMTWGWDRLHWWQCLFFVLAAVMVRVAIGAASIANVRGGLVLAFGMPILSSGLIYALISIFRPAPVGHSCPALVSGSAYACVYQPLIGEPAPWMILGLLAGLWLAYAVTTDLSPQRRGLNWIEFAIVVPVLAAVILWAVVIGPQQAGGAYVGPFLVVVGLTALLRLLLATPVAKHGMLDVATKLGMTDRTAAAS